jgi:hypothetical protein
VHGSSCDYPGLASLCFRFLDYVRIVVQLKGWLPELICIIFPVNIPEGLDVQPLLPDEVLPLVAEPEIVRLLVAGFIPNSLNASFER